MVYYLLIGNSLSFMDYKTLYNLQILFFSDIHQNSYIINEIILLTHNFEHTTLKFVETSKNWVFFTF